MTGEYKQRESGFADRIAGQEKRLLKYRKMRKGSILSGLGMFGMVGWSVAVPSVSGTLIGLWLDKRWPQQFSWTITLMAAGICTGCLIAWFWVDNEVKKNNKDD